MKRIRQFSAYALVALILIAGGLHGQSRSRRGSGSSKGTGHPEAFKGVIVTFDGALKKLTKKDLVIESSSNRELVTFRRNKNTKFMDGDKEIKADAIDLESIVTVDATEDVDLVLMAVTVKTGAPKKPESELKPK